MRKYTLSAAILAMAASSVSYGQTVTGTLTENFDDGLAGNRWDFLARENGLDPATGTPDGAVNFAFNYGSVNYSRFTGNTTTPTITQEPIGPAPGGGGTTGVMIHVNDGNGSVVANAIAQAAITPKTFVNTGDYRVTLDMFANNSDPNASGSSEFVMFGMNADATTPTPAQFVVGDNLPAGTAIPALAANQTANGYAFAASTEGGFAGDYRVYSRKLAGDDGPRFQKRNAAWTGAPTGPIFNRDGTYSGTTTNSEEAFNNYYLDISPGDKNSSLYTGGVGKSWVQVSMEQRGRIVTYTLAGRVINTLFLPNSLGGKVSLGAYDAAASTPADTSESYFLFDNIKIDQLATAGTNVISATDNYAHFTGGTTTSNGAAALNYLEFDTAAATLAGTGTLTLGSPSGAIYAGGASISHTITKPLAINADTAIYVDETSALSATSVTYGTGVDVTKVGRGSLTLNTVRARSLNVESGTVAVPSGASKLELINFGYAGATADTARLDIGKSVFAIDYSNAPLQTSPPATVTPLSPFLRVATFINNGFAPDGTGNPQFNGPGIVTSAPELQGANYATSSLTIRAAEASSIGYGDGATWGATGLGIDATTVLFGVTFKSDTNLDQAINFDDLLKLAQNYNPAYDPTGVDGPKQWFQGDSNGDGIVNFDDLLGLAQRYGTNVAGGGALVSASEFAADWALAQSLVPEPTSLTALGLGALMLRRRRA